MPVSRASLGKQLLCVLLCVCMVSATLPAPASAQVVETADDAFNFHVETEMARIVEKVANNELTLDVPRLERLSFEWRDGVRHVSLGGFCSSVDELLSDSCFPVPLSAGKPSALVWDLRNGKGRVVRQVFLGVFPDAEYEIKGRRVTGIRNAGFVTNSQFPTVYMIIGINQQRRLATWKMWGLRSFEENDAAKNLLDWDWVFLKSGLSIHKGNRHFVAADATAIEYGLISALIAVVIISALTTLGTNLDCAFSHVAAQVGANPPPSDDGQCEDDGGSGGQDQP